MIFLDDALNNANETPDTTALLITSDTDCSIK